MHSRKFQWSLLLMVLGSCVLLAGCYARRGSNSPGEVYTPPPRPVNLANVALPEGYRIDTVATGLNFPTGVAFDARGRIYVVEAGYWSGEMQIPPRLLRLDPVGIAEIAIGDSNGPWTGLDIAGRYIYVAEGGALNGGRILQIHPDGTTNVLVDSLPSMGDYHTNGPLVKDDWVYFGQGTATNSGIVGPDNADNGWLKRHSGFHDIPAEDVTLEGENFESGNLPGSRPRRVSTGAYLPYGTASFQGQRVDGQLPCTGAIMRVHSDGSSLELVASGFRNPLGLAFATDGNLFTTENGYEDRGSRPVAGASDCLWKIEPGVWYGWPDYSAGKPIDNPAFKSPSGPRLTRLLAGQHNPPPLPVAAFPALASAGGFDFSRSDSFGFAGQAFVAQSRDLIAETGRSSASASRGVVRVDPASGRLTDFAVNRGGGGFVRPVAARFNPTGTALYVLDYGVMLAAKKGAIPQPETGVLWRITRIVK